MSKFEYRGKIYPEKEQDQWIPAQFLMIQFWMIKLKSYNQHQILLLKA